MRDFLTKRPISFRQRQGYCFAKGEEKKNLVCKSIRPKILGTTKMCIRLSPQDSVK